MHFGNVFVIRDGSGNRYGFPIIEIADCHADVSIVITGASVSLSGVEFFEQLKIAMDKIV